MERRKHPRKIPFRTQPPISVTLGSETFSARLVDHSETGFGLETARALEIGCRVRLRGELVSGTSVRPIDSDAVVRWTAPGPDRKHLCGVLFDKAASAAFNSAEQDYYEVLQLSPNADPDTIHRVFRVLAQRFHPDNKDTGDANTFKALVRAYEVVGDPARRAAYDAQRPAQQARRWRIFDNARSAQGFEAEKRKRHGILSLLYLRRANEPRDPNMTLIEFEHLLGCPREHLEFALWMLKENAWIARSDNGRFAITAKGVHEAESLGDFATPENRLLASPAI